MYSVPSSVKKFIKVNLKKGMSKQHILNALIEQGFTYPALSSLLNLKIPNASELYRSDEYYKALAAPKLLDNEKGLDLTVLEDRRATVLRLDNFLSEKECESIIASTKGFLKPSTMTSDKINKSHRTSSTGSFLGSENDAIASADHKINKYIDMRLKVYSEIVQVQQYKKGQEYKNHYDFFAIGSQACIQECKGNGQRSWTCMVYLNDVEKGGETEFPTLKLKLIPKVGTAIIWNNLDQMGMPNKKTLHVAHPVIEGEKYIITKWFRDR